MPATTTTPSDELEALQPPSTHAGGGGGYFNSYQHDPPAVQQLGDILPRQHAYYGDATLQPNTGMTNSYDYALFGLALHELLDRLRLSIIINAVLMCVLLFFTWWTRLFRPFDLVVSIALGILVLVLMVVELKGIFESAGTDSANIGSRLDSASSILNNDANGSFANFIKYTEQAGLMVLYHPIGKTAYLVTCGCMCWWIGGVWEEMLGLMFVSNAGVLLYCWVTYPELRRTFDPAAGVGGEGNDNNQNSARSASWSYYYQATSTSVSSLTGAVSEKASLLSSAFHRNETV